MIQPVDFQRESYRIDEQIWESIALRPDESVLFVGMANEGAWISRAIEIGANVSVIGGDSDTIARITKLGATPIRGSATMIPARDGTFDVAIAFHALHEVDPGFHPQIIAQLGRVGKRLVVVEPSPPADALGRRIAAIYGRAKREAGLFEQYQPLEYWRKLVAMVKAEVWQSLYTFTRIPPRAAVTETVTLLLQAMAAEDLPQSYVDELRALAARPDSQLLPLSRIVLVGTPTGESLPRGDGSRFRPNVDLAPVSEMPRIAAAPPRPRRTPAAPAATDTPPPTIAPARGFGFSGDDAPEMPPLLPPGGATPPAFVPPAAEATIPPSKPKKPKKPKKNAIDTTDAETGFGFGLPQATPTPAAPPTPPAAAPQSGFGQPFAIPADDSPFGNAGAPKTEPAPGFGWAWEPPEDEEPKTP
jgi:hypothetical protein